MTDWWELMCNCFFANWNEITLRYMFYGGFFSFPSAFVSGYPPWELAWYTLYWMPFLPVTLVRVHTALPCTAPKYHICTKILVSKSAFMRIKTKATSEPICPIRLSLLGFCNASNKFYLGQSLTWSYENVFLFLKFSPLMRVIPALKFYYSLLLFI